MRSLVLHLSVAVADDRVCERPLGCWSVLLCSGMYVVDQFCLGRGILYIGVGGGQSFVHGGRVFESCVFGRLPPSNHCGLRFI